MFRSYQYHWLDPCGEPAVMIGSAPYLRGQFTYFSGNWMRPGQMDVDNLLCPFRMHGQPEGFFTRSARSETQSQVSLWTPVASVLVATVREAYLQNIDRRCCAGHTIVDYVERCGPHCMV